MKKQNLIRPWTNENMYKTYEEAKERVSQLIKVWVEKKQKHMQAKIRRRSNGLFLIKYRKDPAFIIKENKDGKSSKKNKRNTKKGKDRAPGII